jgi:co-chaperonin GroES (HSP10)
MINLKPLPGRVLVEIREKYEHVTMTEQKYDTKTSGICIAVPEDEEFRTGVAAELPNTGMDTFPTAATNNMSYLLDTLVFWEEYKDGAVIERDGKKYAFIKIEDLDGYEDDESK